MLKIFSVGGHIRSSRILQLVSCSFGIFLLSGLVLFVWFVNLLSVSQAERESNCASLLSRPIPVETIANLCEKDLIPSSLADCQSGLATLYIGDLETIVNSKIIIAISTYEDVTNTFGSYVTYCSDKTARQSNPQFSCEYDLIGWPRFDVIFDSGSEKVLLVRIPTCSGS